jgi:hypothetical protein
VASERRLREEGVEVELLDEGPPISYPDTFPKMFFRWSFTVYTEM